MIPLGEVNKKCASCVCVCAIHPTAAARTLSTLGPLVPRSIHMRFLGKTVVRRLQHFRKWLNRDEQGFIWFSGALSGFSVLSL